MALRGELHPQHKLTERQVRSIRKLWSVDIVTLEYWQETTEYHLPT